jgi:hypothetical protein
MSNVSFTEPCTIKKFFKWTINKFNEFNASNMKEATEKTTYGYDKYYFIESPLMTAIDPYDGKRYTAIFKLASQHVHQRFSLVLPPGMPAIKFGATYRCYFTKNDDPEECTFRTTNSYDWTDDIKKITIYADLVVHRSFHVPAFAKKPQQNLTNRLKEIWKDDSSVKYTIKCGENSFETFKPFLVANSFFFKELIESTKDDFVEIDEFEAEPVQKMIEFCETDNIKDVNGYESDLFKMAHKYQMNDLMEFAIEKMSENANISNIFNYRQLAINYKLKDFEEWCMKFAFPTNVL